MKKDKRNIKLENVSREAPFSVPENYFSKQEEEIMRKISVLERPALKQLPLQTPEEYFENLPMQIQNRITISKAEGSTYALALRWGLPALAASVALIWWINLSPVSKKQTEAIAYHKQEIKNPVIKQDMPFSKAEAPAPVYIPRSNEPKEIDLSEQEAAEILLAERDNSVLFMEDDIMAMAAASGKDLNELLKDDSEKSEVTEEELIEIELEENLYF